MRRFWIVGREFEIFGWDKVAQLSFCFVHGTIDIFERDTNLPVGRIIGRSFDTMRVTMMTMKIKKLGSN